MKRKTLYRYLRDDGGTTVSPTKPSGTSYNLRYRLLAEEGKAITNGTDIVQCVDVKTKQECALWQDCDLPEETVPEEEGIH